MSRQYTKRRRAAQEADTRRRIVEATAALHGEVGARGTSVSAIAERAGVQRLTVYRHFPDEHALFRACASHWLAANPPPDPVQWTGIDHPGERTLAVLKALYAYYRRTSDMWRLSYRDVDDVPALQAPMREFEAWLEGIRDDLQRNWAPARRDAGRLRAVLGHALRYSTWASLASEGLTDNDGAALFEDWIRHVAAGRKA